MSRKFHVRMRAFVSVAAMLTVCGGAWAKSVPEQKPGDPPVVTNNVDRPETDNDAVLSLKSMTMPITATPADKPAVGQVASA